MNIFKDKKETPNALDYIGNYLKQEDIQHPQVVTVIDVFEDELPGEARSKLVARFNEFSKPMVLNTTNIKRFMKIFGTGDTGQWRGEVTLYVDHDIEFGGKTVGGLRVKPATANGSARRQEPSRAAHQQVDEDLF